MFRTPNNNRAVRRPRIIIRKPPAPLIRRPTPKAIIPPPPPPPPVPGPQGQINRGSTLGEAIYELASRDYIKTIVEIGTWNGMGSTKCVIDAIRNRPNANFISLEASEAMYRSALEHNASKPLNAHLIFGRIIEKEELDVTNLTGDEPKWLEDDIKYYTNCPNVIDQIPNQIDLLILDGGEFSSYAEFHKLYKRALFIVMDDTVCRKFKRVREEILHDPSFQVINDSPTDRNGFLIVRNNRIRDYLGGCVLGVENGDIGTYAPQVWDKMIQMFKPTSVIDVGCGAGYSLKYFMDHTPLYGVGIEGWLNALENSPIRDFIKLHDYTLSPFIPDREIDLAWSCEFVEHVEKEFVPNFMATFKKCKRVAITHAVPGQDGHHHVNCQEADYWIEQFESANFKYLEAESLYLRSLLLNQPNGGHVANTLMIFERKDLPISIENHYYLYDKNFTDLSLKYAQTLTSKSEPTKFHFYWRVPRPFSRKLVLPLKSALKTQPNAEIILWSNVDLSKEPLLVEIADKITFKIWKPEEEVKNTPLEKYNIFKKLVDDDLCYLGGDLFRLLCLYKYGGVYCDMDVVLLRDFAPILNLEFLYQWGSSGTSSNEKFKSNGAVMCLKAHSRLATEFLEELGHIKPDPKTTCWGADLYSRVRATYSDWSSLPCAWFNTEWQLGYDPDAFQKKEHSSKLFDGAFAWHWHNKWDHEIEIGSKFEILEQKFRK